MRNYSKSLFKRLHYRKKLVNVKKPRRILTSKSNLKHKLTVKKTFAIWFR